MCLKAWRGTCYCEKRALINCVTHGNEKTTAQKPVPWVLRVISVVGVQEDRPLIASHLNLAINELRPSSVMVTSDEAYVFR